MKPNFRLTIVLILVCTSTFAALKFATWKVKDQSYTVKFKSNRVDGSFKGLKAIIDFDDANPSAAKISATIDVNTAETGIGLRNKHVRQALDAEQHPTIKFESTSVAKKGASFEALGNLTMHGQTKAVRIPFDFIRKGDEGSFSAKFTIKTKDYQIDKWGSPETVNIEINVPVIK